MKFAWKGDDTHQPYTAAFGLTFLKGEATDVSSLDLHQQRRLARNPAFKPADKQAEELAATPRPEPRSGANGAAASELSELWKRLAAVEKDNDTLRKAVADLAQLRGQLEALSRHVDALTEPAETGKPVQGAKDGK